jgi:hypothetical protein
LVISDRYQRSKIYDTGDKFFAGVVDTAEQLFAGVVYTRDKHYFANISSNFRKISKGPQWNTYGPGWGTLIHDKNLSSKISCQTPFNEKNVLFEKQNVNYKFQTGNVHKK